MYPSLSFHVPQIIYVYFLLPDMLYRCVLQVDGTSQPVEIMDTSASCQAASQAHLQWAEAFVVVYAISDKQSYAQAADTLQVRRLTDYILMTILLQ